MAGEERILDGKAEAIGLASMQTRIVLIKRELLDEEAVGNTVEEITTASSRRPWRVVVIP